MSARRLGNVAPWAAGITLALGLHGAAAALLLAHWHADVGAVASAPAILVDFAPAPAAPAVTPSALPPGPPQPQQQAQPQPKPEPKPEQKPEPKQAVAKTEVEAPAEKPVEQTIEVPPTPLALLDVPPEPAPKVTIDVLPPRKPVEARHERKPRHAGQPRQRAIDRRAARNARGRRGAGRLDASFKRPAELAIGPGRPHRTPQALSGSSTDARRTRCRPGRLQRRPQRPPS